MMTLKLNDEKVLNFRFAHDAGKRVTVCNVLDLTGITKEDFPKVSATLAAKAVAKAHPSDIFTKARGRKEALRRALTELGLARDERTKVWEAYHGKRGDADALAAGNF